MLAICKRLFQTPIPSIVKANHFFTLSSSYTEKTVKVLDRNINYLETFGCPQNAPTIFILPGAFGSIEMDFLPIMHEFNLLRYKFIVWDPLGHAKSRPPKRKYQSQLNPFECTYAMDAPYAIELVKVLGLQRFFVVAWSGATFTGIITTTSLPDRVPGFISWAGFGHVDETLIAPVTALKKLGLKAMAGSRKQKLLDMYGEELLLEMWIGWCEEVVTMANSTKYRRDGTFRDTIQKVNCPSLFIHGMKDALVPLLNAEYLQDNIKNSRIHVIQNGTHSLHLVAAKEFVQTVQDFVDANTS